ncbi:MAG TPA: RodZ domain-containing protein [Rhizomicrobium sp.]|jgi:cytoskeleton protein RodZ|nr:RodZ domain-containing protein [Rhizomicrobium sp.]
MSKIPQLSAENDNGEASARRRIHLREISETSGDGEGSQQTVGQELRAARLRRGDEIAQVSRALKIRKDHLEALEDGRLEDLPGKTYAIGFVRSYARHLGLDDAHYVERFKREVTGRAEDHTREPAPIHQDERHLPYGWRLIAGVVVILLAWGGWRLVSSGGDTNQPVPPAPVLTAPKPAAKPVPQPVVAPPQVAVPSPAADASPPRAANDAAEQQASALPPPAAGAKTPATRSTPLSSVSPMATPQAPPASAAVPLVGAGQVYGAANRNPRVVLRARGDVTLTVKSPDGKILLNRDLKSGDSYQVPDLPGLTLATSDAGAVEVDLDGISLGRAGKAQQVVGKVSLDPGPLADRFNNH